MESLATATATFPKKPQRDAKPLGQELKLYSNYFTLEFDSPAIQGVNKYTLKFEPDLPDNSRKVRGAVLRTVKDKVKE